MSPVVGAVKVTVAVHKPASVLAETDDAQVIIGASASVTVTICEHVFVLPFTSVTVQITVVVPNA